MTNFSELAGKAMRDRWDSLDMTQLFTNLPMTNVNPIQPVGYSRRRKILELRRTQYRQWRMGWGKPTKKS